MPVSFWIAITPGAALCGVGIRGLLADHGAANPLATAKLMIGLGLASDVVVVPVSLAVAMLIGRFLPAWLSRPLKCGLFGAAVVCAFAMPAVHRWGAESTNPTVLPRDYLTGLMEILVLAALLVSISAVATLIRQRHARPPTG